jgi:small subunit ribosomal protein S3Ae
MAKKDKKKVSRIKTKKKVWYKILAPKLFGNKEIGESYLVSPDVAVGRTLKINLRELTGSMRDQNVYIKFQIAQVEGSVLKTVALGYQLTPAHVKRVVRKNTARLDDYFTLKTKTGDNVTLKSLLITLHKTQRSTKTQLRKQLGILLEEEMGNVDFDTFISNIVNGKIQTGIKKKLSKIFPVKEVAIRSLHKKASKKKVFEKKVEIPKKEATEAPEEKSEA